MNPNTSIAGRHILPTVGFVSCAHCHALPEGSNNRLTVDGGLQNPHDPEENLASQPTETAALRGLIQREARLSRSGADLPKDSPITGLEGMLHTGFFKVATPGEDENGVGNTNAFISTTFDRLVMTATPLGSERRLASPSGATAPVAGGDPASLILLPMITNTAKADIPELSLNWAGADNTHGGLSAHTVRLLQHGLIASSPPGESGFGRGLTISHDAPRRLRVAGNNIRHGARLELFTHDDPDGGWQRLRLGSAVIFSDSFESGGLEAWSSSTGGP